MLPAPNPPCRPKITIYNSQQGCPVAQQKGGFGGHRDGAGAGVDAYPSVRCDPTRVRTPAPARPRAPRISRSRILPRGPSKGHRSARFGALVARSVDWAARPAYTHCAGFSFGIEVGVYGRMSARSASRSSPLPPNPPLPLGERVALSGPLTRDTWLWHHRRSGPWLPGSQCPGTVSQGGGAFLH